MAGERITPEKAAQMAERQRDPEGYERFRAELVPIIEDGGRSYGTAQDAAAEAIERLRRAGFNVPHP